MLSMPLLLIEYPFVTAVWCNWGKNIIVVVKVNVGEKNGGKYQKNTEC